MTQHLVAFWHAAGIHRRASNTPSSVTPSIFTLHIQTFIVVLSHSNCVMAFRSFVCFASFCLCFVKKKREYQMVTTNTRYQMGSLLSVLISDCIANWQSFVGRCYFDAVQDVVCCTAGTRMPDEVDILTTSLESERIYHLPCCTFMCQCVLSCVITYFTHAVIMSCARSSV